jgi:membrane fusion protein, multidrug efflux system
MKRILISAGLCIAIVLLGIAVIGLAAFVGRDTALDAKAANLNNGRELPNVKVRVLQSELFEDRLLLTGSLAPWEDVTLSAEASGEIEWQGVQEGDPVSGGQELFRINTEVLDAALAQAQAQHTLASQEYARLSRLVERGAGSQQELDAARANLDVAAAVLRNAQIALSRSFIKAPFDGVVDTIYLKQAEFADKGQPLVRIVQVGQVKLKVGIPERDIHYFDAGDSVEIQFDGLPGLPFAGCIERIATTADMNTHTFTTEIVLDNPEGILRPGMIARASLVRRTFDEAILIPIFASILLDEQRYAYVIYEGKAQLRPIHVGLVQGESVQVLSGLSPGERLIVTGQYQVRPDEPVRVTEVLTE